MKCSSQKRKLDISTVFQVLHKTYGDVKCFLEHENPLQLLIATILSAQCTDKTVNEVTKPLFAKYRAASDFAEMKQEDLEQAIRRCGYYHAKAAHIIGACRKIVSDFGGKVPATMEELTSLPGVGRKTANVVLGDWFGVPGLPVDTHVIRLSGRMGLATTSDPVKIEEKLCSRLEPEKWALCSHLIILHGRRRCPASKPDCANCEVKDLCPKRGVKVKS